MAVNGRVNLNLKLWFSILGIITGILAGGFGSAMINSARYKELSNEFNAFKDYRAEREVEDEHRLTKIEAAIARANEKLDELLKRE